MNQNNLLAHDPVDSLHREVDETNRNTLDPSLSVDDQDELSISGETPDPEADDDVLAAAKAVGLGLNETEEEPQPLDIAGDVNRAEQSRLGSDDLHDDSGL